MLVILAFWRLRQENCCEFKPSLEYIARPFVKNKKKKIRDQSGSGGVPLIPALRRRRQVDF